MFREKNAQEIFQAGRHIIRTKELPRLAWADYALGLDSSPAPRLAAFTMLSAFAMFFLLLWLDKYEELTCFQKVVPGTTWM